MTFRQVSVGEKVNSLTNIQYMLLSAHINTRLYYSSSPAYWNSVDSFCSRTRKNLKTCPIPSFQLLRNSDPGQLTEQQGVKLVVSKRTKLSAGATTFSIFVLPEFYLQMSSMYFKFILAFHSVNMKD